MSEEKSAQIIKGPWKDLPKGKKVKLPSEEERERLQLKTYAEDITEQSCVQLIQILHENEFNVDDEEFLRDVGFIIECVKGLIYRELGLQHPMSDFIKLITKPMDELPKNPDSNVDKDRLLAVTKYISELQYDEEDPPETEAGKNDLSYIKLDGKIGCMVNGAGLAMATMDIIKLYGSEPANFLDVGGGASKEKVSAAFKIILSDKNVKGILINIFGGIMRCDVLAQGVLEAVKETKLTLPLVVRLAGTNVELGKEILKKSKLKIISANNLSDAAKKIIEATK